MTDDDEEKNLVNEVSGILELVKVEADANMLRHGAMTLGDMLEKLDAMPQDMKVFIDSPKGVMPGSLASYRGYYDRLAIDWLTEVDLPDSPVLHYMENGTDVSEVALPRVPTVKDMAKALRLCVGNRFYGYKGGSYLMDDETWVHVAAYGETGPAVVDITTVADLAVVIYTADLEGN